MKNPNFLVQVLPVLTFTLFIVFFIIYKILSRIKNQAKGHPDGSKFSEYKLTTPQKMPSIDRVKLDCPAIIERSRGFTKVGIKEISPVGAFVTCPHPLQMGEAFLIKIFFEKENSLVIKADVIWNNNNVPQDQIIARGMKVRFLDISDETRQMINDIVSAT